MRSVWGSLGLKFDKYVCCGIFSISKFPKWICYHNISAYLSLHNCTSNQLFILV